MPGICDVCKNNAGNICGKCKTTWYCSKEHQISHWKIHKKTCFPIRIENDEKVGRYLTASKNLEAGEQILKEQPIVIGPRKFTPPICLGCHGRVNDAYKCSKCGWPLCSETCESSIYHIPECSLSSRKDEVNVKEYSVPNPMYECITPIRCLWLKDNDPENWQRFTKMESHSEDIQELNEEEYNRMKVFVPHFLKNYMKITQFTDEEILFVCRVLMVNAFEIPETEKIAVFPTASLMSHSCLPNVIASFTTSEQLIIRASYPLQEGATIYLSYIDTISSVYERKYILLTTKYFDCDCRRCNDPTDLGTHMSCLMCTKCQEGYLYPPLRMNSTWICNSCGYEETGNEAVNIMQHYSEEFDKVNKNPKLCAKFLNQSAKCLSNNYALRLRAKLILCGYDCAQGRQKQMSNEELTLKISYCREVIAICDILAKGLSPLRAEVLTILQICLYELYERLPKKVKKKNKAKTILQEIENISTEIKLILNENSTVQAERKALQEAHSYQKIVKENLKKFNSEKL